MSEAYRGAELTRGIRRAMAELRIMQRDAEQSVTTTPHPANRARRARAAAYRVAYNRLNQILATECAA